MIELITNDSLVFNMLQTENKQNGNRLQDQGKSTIKPRFTIKKDEEVVTINFSNFVGDTIKVYSKRSSEKSFELLGESKVATFVDKRPNLHKVPELREYKAIYFNNKEQIGTISDTSLIIKKS